MQKDPVCGMQVDEKKAAATRRITVNAMPSAVRIARTSSIRILIGTISPGNPSHSSPK